MSTFDYITAGDKLRSGNGLENFANLLATKPASGRC